MLLNIKIIMVCTLMILPSWVLAHSRDKSSDPSAFSALTITVDEINREPLTTYRKIQSLEQYADQWSGTEKLWWLLRKAQAENLLYLNEQLELTVVSAQQLITEQTQVEISSGFNIYAGILAQQKGEYGKAITLFHQALLQAEKANLNHTYIVGKQELAFTRSLTELYQTSLNEIQEAYVEAFALGDKFLLALINETYGAIYGYLTEYEKSAEYYQKALVTYEQLNYRAHIADAVYGLASTYRYWKKYDLSVKAFERYQQLIHYTPNRNIAFFGLYGLGMTLAEKRDCKQAIKVIDRALLLNGLMDYNAELLKRKASCQIDLGDLSGAEQGLIAAQAIFAKMPELKGTKWVLEVDKLIGILAHAQGDDSKAYQLLNEYLEQYTVLLNKNADTRLGNVSSAMEQARKQLEDSMEQQHLELTTLKDEHNYMIKSQKKYFILFIISLSVFFLIVMIYQRKYTKKILALSIRDPLSNLYNRRYIFDYLHEFINGTSMDKAELSVVLLDIDNFKEVNDKYGHPLGDEVICKVAEIGQTVLRKGDVIGRIGGEEFLCVLPRINPEQCLYIAQRLLDTIREHVFETKNKNRLSVTVSIGIASLSTQSSDADTLYAHADLALYYAKNHGKNRTAVYQPGMK